jgi:hypothetical protein
MRNMREAYNSPNAKKITYITAAPKSFLRQLVPCLNIAASQIGV